MDTSILASRRELLRRTQNADGGWGYFAGKQSWLEPTAYAILALQGDPGSASQAARGWALLRSWQREDGGWKPTAHISRSTWVTALAVTVCVARQDTGRVLEQGVRWLLRTTGVENSTFYRLLALLGRATIGRETRFRGWPWLDDTAAWVEPTAHSLIALRKAAAWLHEGELNVRLREGEQMLLAVRGRDGGWNYGNPSALGVELPSYPETTALALLGLHDRAPANSGAVVSRFRNESGHSRLASAWLGIAAATLGDAGQFAPPHDPPPDLMIAALEALALADTGLLASAIGGKV